MASYEEIITQLEKIYSRGVISPFISSPLTQFATGDDRVMAPLNAVFLAAKDDEDKMKFTAALFSQEYGEKLFNDLSVLLTALRIDSSSYPVKGNLFQFLADQWAGRSATFNGQWGWLAEVRSEIPVITETDYSVIFQESPVATLGYILHGVVAPLGSFPGRGGAPGDLRARKIIGLENMVEAQGSKVDALAPAAQQFKSALSAEVKAQHPREKELSPFLEACSAALLRCNESDIISMLTKISQGTPVIEAMSAMEWSEEDFTPMLQVIVDESPWKMDNTSEASATVSGSAE